MRLFAVLPLLLLCVRAGASEPPDTRKAVEDATLPFAFTAQTLTGPGAQRLEVMVAGAQFVMIGENHYDFATPVFAEALYRLLRNKEGFDVLVVENDRLSMETISAAPIRGDLDRIAAYVRAYPAQIGFASDQDLALYAYAISVGKLWGIEQAQGAVRYLEELESLAPAGIRPRVANELAKARAAESRESFGGYMHDDPVVLGELRAIYADWSPKAGSRADRLLGALVISAEIYSFNRRAGEGEYVGLYNNTWREAYFREQFLAHYRPASRTRPVKALFKMGGNHVYRGKSPVQAYTIGNFVHEFAIANGGKAVGLSVIGVSGFTWEDIPEWMRPVMPPEQPETPVVIDLAPLHPFVGLLGRQAPEADRWRLRDYMLGHDAIIILPESQRATTELTGMPRR